MIWADRLALAVYGLFCLFLLFMYAHGDMEGFTGLLLAMLWSALFMALPLWIAFRLLNYAIFGGRRHYG